MITKKSLDNNHIEVSGFPEFTEQKESGLPKPPPVRGVMISVPIVTVYGWMKRLFGKREIDVGKENKND